MAGDSKEILREGEGGTKGGPQPSIKRKKTDRSLRKKPKVKKKENRIKQLQRHTTA
jgi:hypothetical protein